MNSELRVPPTSTHSPVSAVRPWGGAGRSSSSHRAAVSSGAGSCGASVSRRRPRRAHRVGDDDGEGVTLVDAGQRAAVGAGPVAETLGPAQQGLQEAQAVGDLRPAVHQRAGQGRRRGRVEAEPHEAAQDRGVGEGPQEFGVGLARQLGAVDQLPGGHDGQLVGAQARLDLGRRQPAPLAHVQQQLVDDLLAAGVATPVQQLGREGRMVQGLGRGLQQAHIASGSGRASRLKPVRITVRNASVSAARQGRTSAGASTTRQSR
jgi:hypothetical protein